MRTAHESHIIDTSLGRSRPQKVRVLVAQATTSPADWAYHSGLPGLRDPTLLTPWIHEVIARANKHSVDLVVLPELSVPDTCIPLLQKWSRDSGATVVGGSHYARGPNGVTARSAVVIAGEVYFVDKLNPAPAELSPIAGYGVVPGRQVHVFTGTPVGNFAVLICSDYLEPQLRRELVDRNIDFLCVPAFQRDSKRYHDRMSIDCDEKPTGLYLIYCNMKCDGMADGRSAVFGVVDRIYQEKLVSARVTDGSPPHKACVLGASSNTMVVDFDINDRRPTVPHTTATRPNITVVSIEQAKASRLSHFLEKIAHDDERYARITELFVPPVEYSDILQQLESSKLVFIVGDPGIGKTYTAIRILRDYYDLGYEPIWFTGLERAERMIQQKALEDFRPTHRQIVYFEDPFGRTLFERRDVIFQVFGPLRDRLADLDARVIVTSRKEVFEAFSRESLATAELAEFTREMNVVKPSYLPEGLIQILGRLAKDHCAWYGDDALRSVAFDAIRDGEITTPLAIRDLVFSTERVESAAVLHARIQRRRKEISRSFALEVRACTPSSRLAMLLVYLFGVRNPQQLVMWFDEVSRELRRQNSETPVTTFMQEIRALVGHRIEKFGGAKTRFRFAHPAYEEAFAEASLGDLGTEELALLIILARRAPTDTVRAILRHVRKYSDFTLYLMRIVIAQMRRTAGSETIAAAGMGLIAAFDLTRRPELLQCLDEVASRGWILDRLRDDHRVRALGKLLRLAINRELRSGSADLRTLDSQIDWSVIYKRLAKCEDFAQLRYALEWASRIRPGVGRELEQAMSSTKPEEHSRLFQAAWNSHWEITNSTEDMSDLLPLMGSSSARWLHEIPYRAVPGAAIVVDVGAKEALTRRTGARGINLLPSGIIDVFGEFEEGDSVAIVDASGSTVAFGLAAYSASDIRDIRGQHSSLIAEILHRYRGPAVVSRRTLLLAPVGGVTDWV
jgi:hypothetical protein